MFKYCIQSSMDAWLMDVRKQVSNRAPEILKIFDIFEEEARFGRKFIALDLARLKKGARILEVGAGALLLSCQLVREGFRVAALDPIGDGFSHFVRLREIVIERAEALFCAPEIMSQSAEQLSKTNCFDFAFSINVMEHTKDVALVVDKIQMSLVPEADYHFTCPNYSFPYEPHFNIPTLFSKKFTEKVFRKKIFNHSAVFDPVGAWNSLNFITVMQLKRIASRQIGLQFKFNPNFLMDALARINEDEKFASRRSVLIRALICCLLRVGLHRFAGLVPVAMQPVIDCRISKLPIVSG